MHLVSADTVLSPAHSASLPLTLEQSSSRSSPVVMIAVLLPLGVALLLPFALVLQHLANDPAARAVLADRPEAGIQLLFALGVLGSLLWWPLARFARSLTSGRSITIDRGAVLVAERGLFGVERWSEPVANYAGVAHHVRTSLSGLRHELMLVHRDPDRAVLLAVANRIHQGEVDRLANILGLAEIPSREAYRLSLMRGIFGPAEPQPRLGVART
jgi:signal transduction histidine kinase